MPTRRERDRREEQYADTERRVKEHTEGWKPTAFKIPEGMPLFNFKKESTYLLDVVPYTVSKRNLNKFADPGFLYYELTYRVHRNLGPDGRKSFVCLSEMFNKKCPACEEAARLQRDGNEAHKGLWARERQLFYVIDRTSKEEERKGVQLFEAAYKGGQGYKGFGELLDTKIRKQKNQRFWHWNIEDGKTLEITTAQRKFHTVYYTADDIEFVDREDEDRYESRPKLPSLEELLIEVPYDTFKEVLFGAPSNGEYEEPKGRSTTAGKSHDTSDSEVEDERVDESSDLENEPEDLGNDVEVGDLVTWLRKGKKITGHVKKIDTESDLAHVKELDGDRVHAVDIGDLTVNQKNDESEEVKEPSDVEEEEEEDDDPFAGMGVNDFEEEEEEEKPKPKGKPGRKPRNG